MNTKETDQLPGGAKRRRPPGVFIRRIQRDKESLKSSGTAFISNFLQLWNVFRDIIWPYSGEVLHSIFFLGSMVDLVPKDFFEDSETMDCLCLMFPEAFKLYKHIPEKTPFSILLHLAEEQLQDEIEIKTFLLGFINDLRLPQQSLRGENNNNNYYTLESTVFAVCYSDEETKRFYGASLSCRGDEVRNILINFSCLHVWHGYVSYAVLSHRHDTPSGIKFPNTVKCKAFYRNWNTNTYEDRRPCGNCGQLFALNDSEEGKKDYPYGNCAETECLSKLLCSDNVVHENMVLENYTVARYNQLRQRSLAELKELNKKVRTVTGARGQC